jgi:hypothetical protein
VDKVEDDTHHRRLARTVRSEEPKDPSPLNREPCTVERNNIPEAFVNIDHHQHGSIIGLFLR